MTTTEPPHRTCILLWETGYCTVINLNLSEQSFYTVEGIRLPRLALKSDYISGVSPRVSIILKPLVNQGQQQWYVQRIEDHLYRNTAKLKILGQAAKYSRTEEEAKGSQRCELRSATRKWPRSSQGRQAPAVSDRLELPLISGRAGRKRENSVIVDSVDDPNGAKDTNHMSMRLKLVIRCAITKEGCSTTEAETSTYKPGCY